MKQYLLAFTLLLVGSVDLAGQLRTACVATSAAQPFSVLYVGQFAIAAPAPALTPISLNFEWLKLNTVTGQVDALVEVFPAGSSTPKPPAVVAVNPPILSAAGTAGRFVLMMQSGIGYPVVLLDQQIGQTWLLTYDQNGNFTFTQTPGT